MASQKVVAKSVRLTQEVYAYIEESPGKGFNDKFENIILQAKKEEPVRQKRLAELQEDIDEKQRELYRLYRQHGHLEDFYRMAIRMQKQLVELGELLDKAVGSQNNVDQI